MAKQTAQKTAIEEAIAILTAPGGEADPFESKRPEMFRQVIAETVAYFVRDHPHLPEDGEVIAEEFLKFIKERQTGRPQGQGH